MGDWYEKQTIGLSARARGSAVGHARGARLPGKALDLCRAPRRRRRRREGPAPARHRARGQGRALDGQPFRVAPRDVRDHADRRRARSGQHPLSHRRHGVRARPVGRGRRDPCRALGTGGLPRHDARGRARAWRSARRPLPRPPSRDRAVRSGARRCDRLARGAAGRSARERRRAPRARPRGRSRAGRLRLLHVGHHRLPQGRRARPSHRPQHVGHGRSHGRHRRRRDPRCTCRSFTRSASSVGRSCR